MTKKLPNVILDQIADAFVDAMYFAVGYSKKEVPNFCIDISAKHNYICIYPKSKFHLVPTIGITSMTGFFDEVVAKLVHRADHYDGVVYVRFEGRYDGYPLTIDILSEVKPNETEYPVCV